MGTRRRIATWYRRGKGEFVVQPPGWDARKNGDLVFAEQSQMIAFARASRLILKDVNGRRGYA